MLKVVLFKVTRLLFTLVICLSMTSDVYAFPKVRIGLEILGSEHPELVSGKKAALLVGSASYDQSLRHTVDRLARAAKITAIFTTDKWPRKLLSSASDTEHIDSATRAPVYSIYNPLERPLSKQLNGAEIIVIDVQDIGIRFFKSVTLLAQFLELGKQSGIPILLLDRPNPMNANTISGPLLDIQYRSQFGVFPIPLVYGLTIGELALYFNSMFGINADLTVIGMENYRRKMSFSETGLNWFPPSEHIPNYDTPLYYATTAFLGELGVFSVGVGTTRPFRYILAPWIDPEELILKIVQQHPSGVGFVPVKVQPHYGLFREKELPGIEIVITDPKVYDPVMTGIAILYSLWRLYPSKIPLANKSAAASLDTLLGCSDIREAVVQGKDFNFIKSSVQTSILNYRTQRQKFLIYPEGRDQ